MAVRCTSVEMFAPIAVKQFAALNAELTARTRFRLFESYRSPLLQAIAVHQGRSKAAPFLSAHQLGLAADFVPYGLTGWIWPDAADPEWNTLMKLARKHGLLNSIKWDRPHVEHPAYQQVLPHLKRASKSAEGGD